MLLELLIHMQLYNALCFAGGDADNDHMTLIIAIAAGVGGVLVVAVVIGLLCITVICCCRKGSKTEEKSCMSSKLHVAVEF